MTKQVPTIIPGTRYGHLVTTGVYISSYMDGKKRILAKVECNCDCGNITYKQLATLTDNRTKCCSRKCIHYSRRTHCHSLRGKKTKEYRAWDSMKQKCNCPKNNRYQYYGGKGITYHESLDTFEGFLEIMGSAPSKYHWFTRIDKEADYKPGNVFWYLASGKKQ